MTPAEQLQALTVPPRVLVVGLGAIGGVVMGGLLRHPPGALADLQGMTTNTTVAAALRARGYRLAGLGPKGDFPGPVVVGFDAIEGVFDVIVLAVQPTEVEATARALAAHLSPTGVMVVLQNGLCEDRVGAIIGPERVVGAVVTWGASHPEPGVYARTSAGGFVIGRVSGEIDASVRQVGAVLAPAGPVSLTDNIRGARWSKLAINAAVSTLGTLGCDRIGPLMRRQVVRRLFLEIVTETVRVAQAEGVALQKVATALDLERLALSPREQAAPNGCLSLFVKHAVLLVVGLRYRRMRSSMLAAIERGRPPAVDFLNGEVTRRAAKHGLAAPVSERAVALVHAVAAGELRNGPALIDRLAAEGLGGRWRG